jgi:predicted ArsR family transcriptional regulator
MSRRVDRRRLELQHALLAGPALLPDLAYALGRRRLAVWADLCALEEDGTVTSEWKPRDGWPAGVWAYRLPTLDEQDAREAEQAATEQRVRAALHWFADTTVPDATTTRGGNP